MLDAATAPAEEIMIDDLNTVEWGESEVEIPVEPVTETLAETEAEDAPEIETEAESVAQSETVHPDHEWIAEADTILESIGGRQYLGDVVDYAGRLFGLTQEGPSFLDKLQAQVPAIYKQIESEILARNADTVTPEIEAKIFEKYGINAANAENYRKLDMYGFDVDLINSDVRQIEFMDTLSQEDRVVFQNAPADVKEQIIEAFEKNWNTIVKRSLEGEREEQQARREQQAQTFNSEREAEIAIGAQTNEVIDASVNSLNESYAKSLRLPLTYVEGVMTKAIRAMQGTAKEGEGVAKHYTDLRKAVADKNPYLQQDAIKKLKPYVDAAFRAQLEQEKQNPGDYDFQGFYAPAPKPAPKRTQTVAPQFQPSEQAERRNPEDVDLNSLLFGR